jgi:hypothetical protein
MLQTGIFQWNSTGKTAHKSDLNWLLANMAASNAKMDG